MDLASDQTQEDAKSLLASLAANASSLTYKDLQSKLALNAEAIRTLNQRQYDAAEAIDAAKAELREQEAAFLVETGGLVNPAHLRQWRDRLTATQAKAAHLRNEAARLKAVSSVLSAELHKRDSRREYLIRERLNVKHASHLDAKLAAARVALAEAISAQAWSQGGMSPGDIQPTLFLQNVVLEHTVREEVAKVAAAERTSEEAEVVADKMYGGGK